MGVYHCGEFCKWWVVEEINEVVGASCIILYVEVELLQVFGPILIEVIIQFSLSLHELQRLMIDVDDCLLPNNVMPQLKVGFHNEVHLFFLIRVLTNNI